MAHISQVYEHEGMVLDDKILILIVNLLTP
jgi:hypothetical protein